MMNIKDKIQASGFKQWQVAKQAKMGESTLSRWLREPEELAPDKVEMLEKALKELAGK